MSTSFCSQPGQTPSTRWTARLRGACATSCPSSISRFRFEPTDFTQVNFAVNRVLVRRAMALLRPAAGLRIADMFCGLGNFSLAIARSGADVVGVESSPELVARAAENARANDLSERTRFVVGDLFHDAARLLAQLGAFDRMLIDPPRDGAQTLVHALAIAPRSALSMCPATPLRWPETPASWCTARAIDCWRRSGEYVPAHLARRVHRSVCAGQIKTELPWQLRPELRPPVPSVAIAGNEKQQVEQMHEDIVDIDVELQRRHDVVGLTAVYDLAHVVQDIAREQHYGDG